MTVLELRELLSEYPGDLLVVMSSDSEGNSKAPLAEAGEAMYLAEREWFGETYPTHEFLDSERARELGYTEEDRAPERAVRAIVLWPL